jgi:hypothetical protein
VGEMKRQRVVVVGGNGVRCRVVVGWDRDGWKSSGWDSSKCLCAELSQPLIG